jgi:RNA ligase
LKLTELFTLGQLELELQDGYVKETKHPTLPLTILNYTDKCTYEQLWNDVTTHCRGLIVNNVTHEVIARGPRKFFNYGEPSAATWPLSQMVELSTKEDGSLGIGWRFFDGAQWHYGVATRGSFTSEQALHATELLTDDDKGSIDWGTDFHTRIWEIVYPENRIVLDYGGRDELIPLGTVNHYTGLIQWRPRKVAHSDVLGAITLGEALALKIPDNEEGYVLDILNTQGVVVDHLKLKGERYKELHAAIFGLSEKAIWEQMVEGTHFDFIAALPDEVQPWAHEVADSLSDAFEGYYYKINYVYSSVVTFEHRRGQAEYLKAHHPEIMSPVFNLLDGKVDRMEEWVWKKIKPGHVPFSASNALESASV